MYLLRHNYGWELHEVISEAKASWMTRKWWGDYWGDDSRLYTRPGDVLIATNEANARGLWVELRIHEKRHRDELQSLKDKQATETRQVIEAWTKEDQS